MAEPSRIVRLSDTIDDHVDQLTRDILAIRLAMQDGIITGEERADIERRLEIAREDLDGITADVLVITDAHQLAQQALNAGAVTPWVARRAREKHADYLRLVKPEPAARVIVLADHRRGGPDAA